MKRVQRRKKKGSALTIAVMMTAILTLLAGGMAQVVLNDAKSTYRLENSMKAFFLAEAGFAKAYSILKQDFTNKDKPDLFPQTSLGEGNYDVTILQPNGRVVIQSVGTVKNVQREVYVEVNYDNGLGAFNYGVLSNKAGTFSGNTTVTGNVFSNAQWTMNGNVAVNGEAGAVGTVTLIGNANVSSEQQGASPVTFPTFDFNYYYNLAAPSNRYTGDQSWNNVNLVPTNGVVFVNGTVEIKGNSSLTGALVATGSITITGSFTQTGVSNLPALMSRDDSIILKGNSTSIGDGLIYSGGNNVEIRGNNTSITGQIMAFNQIIDTGNLNLTATSNVPSGINSTGKGLSILTYHE